MQHLQDTRRLVLIAAASLVASIMAMVLPGPSSGVTQIAAILAVGSLALFAGHRWGLMVVGVADVLLLGQIWPLLAFGHNPPWTWATAGVALTCAIPGVFIAVLTLPRMVELVLGPCTDRQHSAGVTCCAVLLAVGLVLPAL